MKSSHHVTVGAFVSHCFTAWANRGTTYYQYIVQHDTCGGPLVTHGPYKGYHAGNARYRPVPWRRVPKMQMRELRRLIRQRKLED